MDHVPDRMVETPVDAGEMPADAGQMPVDAGEMPVDAGETPADGGETATQLRFYPDGPLLVRGDFEMLGRDGNPLPRTRATVALCRCGMSSIKPYCDGSHKLSRFTDVRPAAAEAPRSSEPTSG